MVPLVFGNPHMGVSASLVEQPHLELEAGAVPADGAMDVLHKLAPWGFCSRPPRLWLLASLPQIVFLLEFETI